MKTTGRLWRMLMPVYLAIHCMGAAFYSVAQFGKVVSQLGGICWAVLCIVMVVTYLKGRRASFLTCNFLAALFQLPVIFFFGSYMPFHIASVGIGAHLVLLTASLGVVLWTKGRETT